MDTIIERLLVLVEAGDEEEVRNFIAEHFAELPSEMQKNLAVELFKESLSVEVSEREKIIAAKKDAVALIEALDAAEKELEGESN
ncbi:hypothetical protein K8R03_03900 [Candidatus Kaiserbacteria bacterium]|nr:hypothetical protein [Candidatus Kaiserbacteria bacterium]